MIFEGNRELLEGFREGKAEALRKVYEAYARKLDDFLARGFSFRSRGRDCFFRGYHDPFDRNNAIAETFTRAFSQRTRQSYDGINPYRNYLFAIARNIVIAEFGRREIAMSQFKIKGDAAFAPGEVPSFGGDQREGAPSAETEYLRKELKELLWEFEMTLDDKERRFFELRYREGMNQLRAGASLGMSRQRTRTFERKLKERFFRFLTGRGYLSAARTGEPELTSVALV